MLKIGQRVRVKWNSLEQNAYGVVKSYHPETEWYTVDLERTKPPFRGMYAINELEVIEENK